MYTDHRERDVDAPAAALWRVIEAIGGEHWWYSFPLAWSVRGWLDRLVGGVDLRRGPHHPHLGEALDFWRVEEIIPGNLQRLHAEMRLPGQAWLEMRATETAPARSSGAAIGGLRARMMTSRPADNAGPRQGS
jgi:hypothetical protein